MQPTASIVIPTRKRSSYLEVALASIVPQAAAAGAELLVVEDDLPSYETRAVAARFGAGCISNGAPFGLNAARNAGVDHTKGELVVFVDDDVEVQPGWLEALLRAAGEHPHVEVFAGPIHARFEGSRGWDRRTCGRERPPITSLDLGPDDTGRIRFAWGANMAVRRSALERVGPFDTTLAGCGDEQEWQERLLAHHPGHEGRGGLQDDELQAPLEDGEPQAPLEDGEPQAPLEDGEPQAPLEDGEPQTPPTGAILYVAAAALDHRRTPTDARLRPLTRAARARGRASRRYDAWRGAAPPLQRELHTLAGCLGHVVRRRCPGGLTMVAHSLGRLEQGVCERRRRRPPNHGAPRAEERGRLASAGAGANEAAGLSGVVASGTEDFLSGESGTVGGLDAVRREVADRVVDVRELLSGQRLRLARAARRAPSRRRVLVLGVERPDRLALANAIKTELMRSRHEVHLHFAVAGKLDDADSREQAGTTPAELGKFQNLNRLLAGVAALDGRQHSRHAEHGAGGPDFDCEPIESYDWLLVLDDDVVLPRGFLDALLFLAERFNLQLAQPAHRARSHAAWRVTRRRAGVVARETAFVEIGPVTAFARTTFPTLLPFPDVRMGWGLDLHWAALARAGGWRCGVLDAVAIRHSAAPAGDAYSRAGAVAEARSFLAERPYLSAREAARTLATHRSW